MTASLQAKNGVYYAVFRVTDISGKTRQKWVSTKVPVKGGKKRDAQKIANDLVRKYEDGHIVDYPKMPFAEWVVIWLEQKKLDIDIVTYQGYKSYADRHIVPYFKERKITLQGITPQHIQDYYTYKQNPHGKSKGLSGRSIRDHHVVIRCALEMALRKNIISYNPADRVDLPKQTKYVGNYYTVAQAQQLIAALNDEPVLKPIVLMTLYYGLRRSEVIGLKWSAINFEEKCFEVCSTVVRFSTLVEKESTKNKSSNRTLPLTEDMATMLKKLKAEQAKNKLLLGEDYQDSDYVFTWPDGRLVMPDYVSKKFLKMLEKHNLPRIRYHDLRHTTASLLLSNGHNLKDVQEWLGHKNINTTANIYGHLDFERKKKTADDMSLLLQSKAL